MSAPLNNLMTLEELLHSVNGKLLGGFNADFVFTSVVTDSRSAVAGSLFIPLIGEKQNGHIYIDSAIEKGAASVFISDSEYKSNRKIRRIGGKTLGNGFYCC